MKAKTLFARVYKQLLSLCVVLCALTMTYGQTPYPGCPNVSSTATDPGSITQNDSIYLACGDTCATLQASFLQTGSTTSYKTSSIPFAPPFPFTGGTSIFVGSDDIYTGVINLPFQFCFFNNLYNRIVIGANGLITFDVSKAGTNNCYVISNPIPNATNAANCGLLADGNGNMVWNSVYGAFHDMDPTVGNPNINYSILGQFPCRTFVVNWSNVTHFGSSCANRITTQQIVLYETTNVIEVYMKDKPLCTGSTSSGRAVVGIQNNNGTLAYSPPGRNTGQWSAQNEAWRFTPDGAPNYAITWLDENNNTLTTGPNLNICAPPGNPNFKVYTQVEYTNCGTLQVLVKDSVQVIPAPPYTANVQTSNVSCNAACDGTATVSISGGKPPYTYSYPSGPGSANQTGMCAQSGNLVITDANNCAQSFPITITEPNPLTTTMSSTDVLCNGEQNGTATVSVSGGTTPYVYNWTSGSTTNSATAGFGKQIVTVRDGNGCVKKDSININEPAPLVLDTNFLTHLSCPEAKDGEIDVFATGGVSPYSFSIDGGLPSASTTFNNLDKGVHLVTLTDANNCSITKSYTLTADSISLTVPNDTSICAGEPITLTASGFFTSVYWVQSEVNNGVPFTPAVSGMNEYEAVAQNASGCSMNKTVEVTVVDYKDASIQAAGPFCLGDADEQLLVAETGGVWAGNGVNSTGLFSPTAAGSGSHTITYTFAGQCPSNGSITIEVNSSFEADINPVSPVCESVAPFNLTSVTPGGTWNGAGIANNTSPLFDPALAGPGTHRIYHTIGGSCGETDSTDIQVLPGIFGNIDDSPKFCHDDSPAQLSATPASGSWVQNAYLTASGVFDPTAIGSGQQQVIYIPTGSCAKNDTAFIQVLDTLIALPDTFNLACKSDNNGTVNTIVNGGSEMGYTYSWPHNASLNTSAATNLGEGQYSVNVSDSEGCSTSTSHEVLAPATGLTLGTISITNTSCSYTSDGQIIVPVSGGTPSSGASPYTYTITPNVGTANYDTFDNLTANTYTIIATDANGCTISTQQTVTSPTPIAVLTTITNANCSQNDGEVHIDGVSGGTAPYTFYWDGVLVPGEHLSNVVSGTYNLEIIDANNCSYLETFIVPNNQAPVISTDYTTPTTCFSGNDGTLKITINGGTQPYVLVDWGPGFPNDSTLTGLSAGTYNVTITDNAGCNASHSVMVSEPSAVSLNPINDTTICNAETLSINFVASNGNGPAYTYRINGNPPISNPFNTNAIGTYTVQAFDVNNCPSNTETFTLSFYPDITSSISIESPGTFCPGDIVNVSASATGGNGDPYNYTWSNGTTGNSTSYATDFSGNPLPISVDVSDGCSYDGSASSVINFYPLPSTNTNISKPSDCTPLQTTLTLDETSIQSFQWSVGSTISTKPTWEYNQSSPGTYPVSLKTVSNEGCVQTFSLGNIVVHPLPTGFLKAYPTNLTTLDNLGTFTVIGNDIKSTAWTLFSFPDSTLIVTDTILGQKWQYTFDPVPANYQLSTTLISPFGCLSYLEKFISVKPVFTLYVPNVFTPDGDGLNDYFSISTTYVREENFKVEIFNRWGELIFESKDLDFSWDGKYHGEIVQIGTYVYKINYQVSEGNRKAAYGSVSVIH